MMTSVTSSPRPPAPARARRRVAMPYYGGKSRMLGFILPLLPRSRQHHYVDVFGGSASVLINIDPPYRYETYNDIDEDAVTFFQVLRERPDELVEQLRLTPYARVELANARRPVKRLTRLERARRFYVRATMSVNSMTSVASKTGFRCAQKSEPYTIAAEQNASKVRQGPSPRARWRHSNDVDGGCWAPDPNANRLTALHAIAGRIHRVQIECRPALEIIRDYDTPNALFYCDPPYLAATRASLGTYRHEMAGEEQHRELAAALNQVRGKVLLSGYRSELYDELYPVSRWRRIDDRQRMTHAGACWMSDEHRKSGAALRRECCWCNYDRDGADTMPLFAVDGGGRGEPLTEEKPNAQ